MIIKALVENTTSSPLLNSEHGISFYIKTLNHNLLFDLGYSDLFLENANKLNVDIKKIDKVIISHGHNDHGGGLKYFLNENKKAKVYINKYAFDKHFAKRNNDQMEDIGLDVRLKKNNQIVLTKDVYPIDENMFTFSNVYQNHRLPLSNSILYTMKNNKYIKDDFKHEQDLLIKENNKLILFTGCSHNGILNIVEHFKKLAGVYPDYVIGGFHLSSRSYGSETEEYVKKLANDLLKTKAKYYTCHCTGLENYKILKEIMKDKLDYLSTGKIIEI